MRHTHRFKIESELNRISWNSYPVILASAVLLSRGTVYKAGDSEN